MAKLNGPLGSTLHGKVGEVVATKTVGGDTAIRAYRSKIKNPKTLRQRVSRNKLKTASGLAALLADAINIGYAKAVAGAKMYARNMFVKEIIPVSAGVMTLDGETITVQYNKITVSKAVGLSAVPIAATGEGTEPGSVKVTLSNADAFPLGAGERLGLVVVGYNSTNKVSLTRVSEADEGVTFSAEEVSEFGFESFYAFVKVIPEAYNGVDATQVPWKYPSNTSTSVFLS